MALDGTYAGLQASIASWLHRSDMGTVITDDLIPLAEARIARDLRLRRQITDTTLATVASTRTVALPSDYLELVSLSLDGEIDGRMTLESEQYIDGRFPIGGYSGKPVSYAIRGDSFILGPVPDAVYTLNISYYAKFSALSVAGNWLLTNHPNIYLFGALAESGDWTQDDTQVGKWEAKYAKGVKELQDADDAAVKSGAAMRVRAK